MSSDLRTATKDTWRTLCDRYDVPCEESAIEGFFSGVDLSHADAAAETVVVNALLEVIERVDRFSPWYTEPGGTFGLEAREGVGRARWKLTEDAADRYRGLLDRLSEAIKAEGEFFDTLPRSTDIAAAGMN